MIPWTGVLLGLSSLAAITPAATVPASPVIAGAKVKWISYAASPLTDWTNRVIELPDGKVVAAGFINRDDRADAPDWNAFIESYDAHGRRIWSQSFGGPGVDAAWAVHARADGTFALGGIASERSGGDMDAALDIIDERGQRPVNLRFGGSGDDRATDLVELVGGDLLLVGQSDSSGAGGIDVFLVRTNSAGQEQWRRTYGTSTDDRGFFGVALDDGGAIIGGVTGPRGAYDLLLFRVAADGTELWRRIVGGVPNDATHGIARLSNDRIMLAGYGTSWNGRGNDISVLIFDEAGRLLSHKTIGGPGDDRVQFAAADPSGGVWLTGYTKSFSETWRLLLAYMPDEGVPERWLGAIGGAGDMHGSAVTVAQNGDLLLGGYTNLPSGGAAPPDAFTMRVARDAFNRQDKDIEVRDVPLKCTKTTEIAERCI